jgi:hypothetical protein
VSANWYAIYLLLPVVAKPIPVVVTAILVAIGFLNQMVNESALRSEGATDYRPETIHSRMERTREHMLENIAESAEDRNLKVETGYLDQVADKEFQSILEIWTREKRDSYAD